MKIGVIGTGNIGQVIIRKLTAANHDVKIANSRGQESLKEFANEVGAKAVSVTNAVEDVDVVFIVIPTKNIPNLPKDLFKRVQPGAVVIDTTNYYPVMRDEPIEDLEQGMIESEWVSKQIKYPVVKSFNTMFSHSMIHNGRPAGAKDRLALAISGDDIRSKEVVSKIIDSIGYDPVDIGTIADSWRQQAGSPIYCTDLTKEEVLYWYPKTKRESLTERRKKIINLYLGWPKDVTLETQTKDVRNIFHIL
ncbi:NADPH-dependent F420 reductase [Leptospira vanthielii]|uniref:NADP oxidoreductase coenzyme F420-dependent n=1 Tax=Leptospira vanthielii serovar Holland str. Waz Holland = ATCC 700522 TaxID=1218591 RepID=N1W4R2_9LEPT|nr:NAD(P)-binding domain-containing protein [Leptospira vanthielii]EMY68217.1 NADP oxidoreductase coenzyme F420-dependent [Leptospira vanthielii serovar Holland str. Waz Holland = ATCC 700522]